LAKLLLLSKRARDNFSPLKEEIQSVWDFGLALPSRMLARCFTNQASHRSVHSSDLSPVR